MKQEYRGTCDTREWSLLVVADIDGKRPETYLAGGRFDGLSIHDGARRIRLKWHKLRRHAEDPPFHRPNLVAGLAAGASMEVDIQPLADGGFVCLHDPTLETETNGAGPVPLSDSATIRALRQLDRAGRPTGPAPLLLDELTAIIAGHDADEHATVQLDLKMEGETVSDLTVERFSALVAPVARHLALSGEDWPAVLRLGGGVDGLSLGYDPMPLLISDPGTADDLAGFADRVMSLAPRAETIFLHHSVFAEARQRGVDLVGAFHSGRRHVDCWTIGTDRAGTEAQLAVAVASGVDQITTDTPGELQALWTDLARRRG